MLVDDPEREDEGDLLLAAEFARPEHFTLMAEKCRTLITLAMAAERIDALGIPMMVNRNTARYETPFTVSLDVKVGTTTGSSAIDRVTSVRALLDPAAKLSDFATPGHVFPLRADPEGVSARMGHTEGVVDLMRLSGLYPAALISEVQGRDGAMMRGTELLDLAAECGAPVVSVMEIKERLIEEAAGK